MTKVSSLAGYCLMGENIELNRVAALHEMVRQWRERFLEDHEIQDLLLNRGYSIDDPKRPETYHDIHDMIWNRSRCSLHLSHVENLINLVIKPGIVAVRFPSKVILVREGQGIIWPDLPEEPEPTLETPEGFDATRIERLQQLWLLNTRITPKIRAYQQALQTAFDEHNMKFILGRMYYAQMPFIPSNFGRVYEIHQEMRERMDVPSFSALDSAYYGRANTLFSGAGRIWEVLSRDRFGKLFILNKDEDREGMISVRSGMSYGLAE